MKKKFLVGVVLFGMCVFEGSVVLAQPRHNSPPPQWGGGAPIPPPQQYLPPPPPLAPQSPQPQWGGQGYYGGQQWQRPYHKHHPGPRFQSPPPQQWFGRDGYRGRYPINGGYYNGYRTQWHNGVCGYFQIPLQGRGASVFIPLGFEFCW